MLCFLHTLGREARSLILLNVLEMLMVKQLVRDSNPQMLVCINTTWESITYRSMGPTHRDSNLVGQEWEEGVLISVPRVSAGSFLLSVV